MLQDKHVLWDDNWKMPDVVAKCQATIERFKANKSFWMDEGEDWENFFALQGLEYGVNPGWLVPCVQRERSLAGKEIDSPSDLDFAAGVVGQDKPGTANVTYNGFVNQVCRAARISAWHLGNDWTPRRKGLEPSPLPRWRMGATSVALLNDKGESLPGLYPCRNRAEFMQLRFTPHLHVLEANEIIMRDFAPLFYQ